MDVLDELDCIARERVSAGARWLDEVEPGWAERIDLDDFRLADGRRCILGQLYGSFCDGLDTHDLEYDEAEMYGFYLDNLDGKYDHWDEGLIWIRLEDQWIAEIKSRIPQPALS
jgi:hypothetical protein